MQENEVSNEENLIKALALAMRYITPRVSRNPVGAALVFSIDEYGFPQFVLVGNMERTHAINCVKEYLKQQEKFYEQEGKPSRPH